MKAILKTLLLVTSLLLGSLSTAWAAETGSADEAIALVKKAIASMKTNGPEKTFADINNPKGPYVDRDLYIFVSEIGANTMAHGANPRMVGKSMGELKDADGKFFVREFLKVAEAKGSGWVDYKWTHPTTKELVQKSTYVEKYDKYLFGCGIYKK